MDNPEGFLGYCQENTIATYTVACVWGDTGTMIFTVEFGTWACGQTGIPPEELARLDIQRFSRLN